MEHWTPRHYSLIAKISPMKFPEAQAVIFQATFIQIIFIVDLDAAICHIQKNKCVDVFSCIVDSDEPTVCMKSSLKIEYIPDQEFVPVKLRKKKVDELVLYYCARVLVFSNCDIQADEKLTNLCFNLLSNIQCSESERED